MRAVLPILAGLAFAVPGFGWAPGAGEPSAGLSVDTSRRNDVLSFWHHVYEASEGYEGRIGWTGNYSNCSEGTTSRAFQDDVQRRINFVRALAGLRADVLVNDGTTLHVDSYYNPPPGTLRSVAAQRAAHMMARTAVVTHNPPASMTCFTSAAGNACLRSSLAYTFYGPGAIDEYMRETSILADTIWSECAGHRRWILYPGATTIATGDTPGAPGVAATNVLYCIPTAEELEEVEPAFVAWPAAGCFPDRLNTRIWSLSHPDADFSSANVSMTGPAGAVSVTIIDCTSQAFGDPSIVWQVPASAGAPSVPADTVYQVAVTGIQGSGVPSSHSYEVTLVDPYKLNEPMELVGSAAPPTSGAVYAFQGVDLADDHVVDVSQQLAATWTEGAEDSPAPRVVDGTSAGYSLRSSMSASYYGNFWRSGSKAFRLAFDAFINPPVEDSFELDRELVTGNTPQLSFHYKRGYMSSGTKLLVETSVDDGLSWQSAGSAVSGGFGGSPDTGFTLKTVSLPADRDALRVRFRHDWTGGAFYAVQQYPTYPVGIFIDDITVSDAQELQSVATLSLGGGASSFRFDSAAVGRTLVPGASYQLRLRAMMANHEFPFGPTMEVTVTGAPAGGFEAWLEYEQPLLTGGFDDDEDGDGFSDGTEYAFGTDPFKQDGSPGLLHLDKQAGVLRLSRSLDVQRSDILYEAEWSENMATWSTTGVSVSHSGGELVAELPFESGRRFLRWRISRL
jgi:hypothetical protein